MHLQRDKSRGGLDPSAFEPLPHGRCVCAHFRNFEGVLLGIFTVIRRLLGRIELTLKEVELDIIAVDSGVSHGPDRVAEGGEPADRAVENAQGRRWPGLEAEEPVFKPQRHTVEFRCG